MRAVARAVIAVLAAAPPAALLAPAPAAAGAPPPTAGAPAPPVPPPGAVRYRPPVDAPVVDGFRAPATRYGAGNRGLEYATWPGAPVAAAAAGTVVFAGQVGGSLHVVVLHADGVRTSYSFLASVAVGRGERVGAGDVVGIAGPSLHFGARAGEAYLDPNVLFDAAPAVRLVPDVEQGAAPGERGERAHLEDVVRRVGGAVGAVRGAALDWARRGGGAVAALAPGGRRLRALASAVPLVPPLLARTLVAAGEWWHSRSRCTPPGVVPPTPGARRLAVLVGGLGSTSRHAAVDDVDTAALGYAPGDVVRFSYRGGTTAERSYGPADTQVDLRESGRRLRQLLERLHRQHPGVPVDVVAHSQGGLVARAALGQRAPPAVGSVITLGSPHHGADLATAAALHGTTPKGALVQAVASRLRPAGIDPRSTSVGQMSETSAFVRALNADPLPAGVRFTSIAARGDVVVASPRSRLAGAGNVVVSVPGLDEHGSLPGSAAARREMALALAGMPPTCQELGDAVADVVVGEAIGTAEDLAGLALAAASR